MGGVLRWVVATLLILAAAGGVLYARRSNPIEFISGRQLTGEVVTEPVSDWSFAKDYPTIALETRPGAPHSVTAWCLVHEGKLYVPASAGSTKSWTHYAAADPRVRIKIGDKIYPGVATRVVADEALREPIAQIARDKYNLPAAPANASSGPSDVWLFRIDSPQQGAALENDVATSRP
jgi:hypothetical protein